MRRLGQRLLRRVQHVGVPALPAPAHPAAQLVQLGEAEGVAALDDQGVGIGDVDPGLDDRGRHQDVELLLPEVDDHLLQLGLAHLPVRGGDPRLRHQLLQPGGRPVDRLDPVVDVEHLALAQEFTPDRGRDLLLVVRADEGQHRVSLLRRGGDGGHLPDPGDRHLQGARDRGRGHGEHVDVGPQLLQLLLVLDAEALLLVDDDQAEVLEPGLRGEQPVGADDDVHRALEQPLQYGLGLAVALEPGQRLHVHREVGVALGEGREVLLHQQRGRHQHRDLLAVLHRLEGRPHRDLGLAVADVAADQPVHRDGLLHVRLDLGDGGQLVGRLRVGEGVLQLALPRGVRAEGVAGGRHPGRVQLDQVGGDLLDRLLGPLLGLRPVRAAQPVQRRGLAADVLGDLVELVGRHEQPVAGVAPLGRRVLQHQVLAGGALHGALHHLHVPADAVRLVHHVVAGHQRQRVDRVAAPGRHPPHVLGGGALAGQVGLGDHGQLERLVDEAVLDRAAGDVHDVPGGGLGQVGDQPGRDALVAEHLGEPGGRSVALGHHDHPPVGGQPLLGVGDRPGGVAPVRLDRVHAEGQGVGVELQQPIDRGVAGRERADRPPRQADLGGVLAHLGERAQRGGRDVDGLQVDGPVATGGGGHPGGVQELLTGRHQVGGAGADPLGVADHGDRAQRQHVDQQLHVLDQDGSQRLHALDRDALGDPVQDLGQARVLGGQFGGPRPYLVGQQQLSTGRRPQTVLGDLQRALVGHLEEADLLDLVAPELHPQRVLLGRREDVQDAAAHRELAALLDEFDPGVGGCGKLPGDLLQIVRLAPQDGHRLQFGQPLDLRLQHRADRRDDHLHRPGRRVVDPRVDDPAQHREPAAYRVRARGEPLVRQCLPGRELGDRVRRQQ